MTLTVTPVMTRLPWLLLLLLCGAQALQKWPRHSYGNDVTARSQRDPWRQGSVIPDPDVTFQNEGKVTEFEAFFNEQPTDEQRYIRLQIWRRSSLRDPLELELVGQTSWRGLDPGEEGYRRFRLRPPHHLHVQLGDVYGFSFKGTSPIGYDVKDSCKEQRRVLTMTSEEEVETGRQYMTSQNQETGNQYITKQDQETGYQYMASEDQETGNQYITKQDQETGYQYMASEDQETANMTSQDELETEYQYLAPQDEVETGNQYQISQDELETGYQYMAPQNEETGYRYQTPEEHDEIGQQFTFSQGPGCYNYSLRVYTHEYECEHLVAEPEKEGIIMSPNYPGYYPNNNRSCWLIKARTGQVQLTADELNTEFCYDYIHVYDGPMTVSPLLETWCGFLETRTRSTGSALMVVFRSDHAVAGFGFVLLYEEINARQCTELEATSDMREIQSPEWPAPYPNDVDVCWVVTAADRLSHVTLNFSLFQLPVDNTCKQDSLTVYDGETSADRVLGRYCEREPPAVLTSSGAALLIAFRSDAAAAVAGFRLEYSASDRLMSPDYELEEI